MALRLGLTLAAADSNEADGGVVLVAAVVVVVVLVAVVDAMNRIEKGNEKSLK